MKKRIDFTVEQIKEEFITSFKSILIVLIIFLGFVCFCSCSKEPIDIPENNDTIYVDTFDINIYRDTIYCNLGIRHD